VLKKRKRFYSNGVRAGGYWAIKDKLNKDNPIWIDCDKAYLKIIIKALNGELEGKVAV